MSDPQNLSMELERLRQLHDDGTLSFREFEEAKRKILEKFDKTPRYQPEDSSFRQPEKEPPHQAPPPRQEFSPPPPRADAPPRQQFGGSSRPYEVEGDADIIMGMPVNTYCTLMHLSQFLGWAIPVVGLLAPICLWIYGKEQSETVNAHGTAIMNWLISVFIYGAVSALLVLLLVGVLLLAVLGILCVIFPIMGAIAANSGEHYRYPFAIEFIK